MLPCIRLLIIEVTEKFFLGWFPGLLVVFPLGVADTVLN